MEIEATKKKDLTKLIKTLDLEKYRSQSYNNDVLKELFGFTIPKTIKEVTFTNSKKLFGKLVTKNKPLFNKIADEQKDKYKELKLKISNK